MDERRASIIISKLADANRLWGSCPFCGRTFYEIHKNRTWKKVRYDHVMEVHLEKFLTTIVETGVDASPDLRWVEPCSGNAWEIEDRNYNITGRR